MTFITHGIPKNTTFITRLTSTPSSPLPKRTTMDPLSIGAAEKKVSDFEATLKDAAKATYEEKKKERIVLRRKVTVAVTGTLGATTADPVDNNHIRAHLKKLEDASERLEACQIQMEILITSDEAAESDSQLHQHKYANKVVDAETEAANAMAAATAVAPPVTTAKPASILLPKAQLPKFSGQSSSEFESFHNVFESMVGSKNLTKTEKLTYLKICLEGEAKVIANGYSEISDANYDNLLKHLRQKFGQPRLIQRDHFYAILEMKDFNYQNMGTWLNQYMTHVRSLESQGVDIEANSGFLVSIAQKRMPMGLYTKWEEEIANETRFSARRLFDFLEIKAKACFSQEKPNNPKDGVKQKSTSHGTASVLATTVSSCSLDNQNHKLEHCQKFMKMSQKERYYHCKSNHICVKCLQIHSTKKPCQGSCTLCIPYKAKSHHTLLHFDTQQHARFEFRGGPTSMPTQRNGKSDTKEATITTVLNGDNTAIMKSCIAKAVGRNQQKFEVRVFIDEGSDRSFCTEGTQQKGQFQSQGVKVLSVSTFGEEKGRTPKPYQHVTIPLEGINGETIELSTTIWNGAFSRSMRAIPFDPKKRWPHLKNINIQDNYPRSEAPVDILIGLDQAYKILRNEYIEGPHECDPVAQNTKLGWIIFGPIEWSGLQHSMQNVAVNKVTTSEENTEKLIESFWNIENDSVTIKNQHSREEENILKKFNETIKYDTEQQQYEVTIPFSDDINKLEDNKNVAIKAYFPQERKVEKDPTLRQGVNDVLGTLRDEGMIEKVPNEELNNPLSHYLMWHTVVRPGHPTTPVRVVNNASKPGRNGISLNSCQPEGPNLLPEIPKMLISWRRHRVAIIADLTKMFLQLKIATNQKDLHRFLFRFDTEDLLQVWRYTVLLFGGKSSPFMAAAAIKHHANRPDIKMAYPKAVRVIEEDEIYVDDCISGAASDGEAFEVYSQLRAFFESMHMQLHKFNSNSKIFLDRIEQSRRSTEKEVEQVLGVKFDTTKDEIYVNVKHSFDKTKPITKRVILSTIASIFDPIGMSSPLLSKAKMILQRTWMEGLSWDQEVSKELQGQFLQWILASKSVLKVTRPYAISKWSGTAKQLHVFSDASEQAYSACIYLVAENKASFVISKTRVRPLKIVSLPRLELLGALIGTRLAKMTLESLKEQIRIYYWCDSKIVVGWVKTQPYKMKTFVANRVAEIQGETSAEQWLWVPGDQNPADLPSRGIWPLDIEQQKLFMQGPDWLAQKEDWPIQPDFPEPKEEMKKTELGEENKANVLSIGTVEMERISDLSRLLNVQSYVFRFVTKPGARDWTTTRPSTDERNRAQNHFIVQHQQKYFAEELKCLEKGKQLSKKSTIISLNPFIDETGILRVGGRLEHSNLTASQKHQIILAPQDHLTQLIIEKVHTQNLHTGTNQTLSMLRESYWILKGGQTVKKFIKRCVKCQKISKKPMDQKMAPLPDFRCQESPPFTHVGVDYAGPLFVKEFHTQEEEPEIQKRKVWIALFTCATTRAIHLEVVNNMTADSFLAALHRFTARRGMPSHIYSDNAKTFTRAEKELKQLYDLAKSDEVTREVIEQGINWHYNPPLAPHWGGMWERLVRSVKTPLKKVIQNALVTETELYTVLCQIERQINSRPLTAVRDEAGIIPLTPAMILIGRNYENYPQAPPPRDNEIIQRWRYRQQLENQFWNSWTKEYLPILQQRQKWHNQQPNLQIDDIVLITTEAKRQTWPLGRVEQTFVGRDGLIRSADIRVGNKMMKRPITQLVRLEID